MKELVLRPFALECSLEAETAFHLLDSFFVSEYRKFYHFEQVNTRMQQFA